MGPGGGVGPPYGVIHSRRGPAAVGGGAHKGLVKYIDVRCNGNLVAADLGQILV